MDRQPSFSKRTRIILVAIGIVLAVVLPAAFVGAETFLSTFFQTTAGVHLNATDGPEVNTTKDYNLRSGNPFTDKSVNLSTQNNGWINISTSDPDSSAMSIQIDEINGTFTNASQITATSGNITLQPSDKNFTTVGGGIDSIQFNNTKVNDSRTDVIYTASGSDATIVVETNATEGVQYGLIDQDTGTGLDIAIAKADGTIHFTSANTGTHETRIEALGTLEIREENEPHTLVTSATAEVIFYENVDDDPTIERRTTNDGSIDLTDLPVNKEFAVRVSADGYYNRTVLIEDLASQQTAFLLDKNRTGFDIGFTIEDPTGQFTSEDATIQTQRAINRSKYDTGGYQWLTIAGDRTGAANKLALTMQNNTRYRLKVSDGAGDVRIVGSYTVTGPDSVTLRPEAPSVNITDVETFVWNASQQNTSTGGTITFEYFDPNDDTTGLTVQIYEQGNASNAFPNQTVSGPLGYTKITQTLTDDQADRTWIVEWDATYNGASIGGKKAVGQPYEIQVRQLAPWIRNAIAALILILTGALFSIVNARTGAVVVSFVGGGLWMVGWLPTDAGAAIMIAAFIAILWKAASARGTV